MPTIQEIKAPILREMEEFEVRFKSSMKSSVPLLDKIMHYIVKRKGKKIRPILVFLSANMHGGVNEATYRGAALIELLHTATLVHDDVVDDSHMRRGMFSINALWKNKIAVLVGDYLLSKGLLLAVDNNDFDQLRIVSNAVREMSQGELLQIEKTRQLNINEEVYFEIIKQKTATLVASCCACGAISAGADDEQVQRMWKFGVQTGIAFQIKDDLFDYGSGMGIGKPTGIDIKEKKITLPLIYTLNNASYKDKKRIVNIVKNHNKDKRKVAEVIQFVTESGGIEYATKMMHQYKDEALEMLQSFNGCEARSSLEKLVNFTVERKK